MQNVKRKKKPSYSITKIDKTASTKKSHIEKKSSKFLYRYKYFSYFVNICPF